MEILNEKDYVDKAESVIKQIKGRGLTTTKIRNLLSLTTTIYNEVQNQPKEELSDDVLARIQYLRLRFAYEAGRDEDRVVRDFVEKAEILKYIKQIDGKRSNLLVFCKYMEALVAYHRYYGGND